MKITIELLITCSCVLFILGLVAGIAMGIGLEEKNTKPIEVFKENKQYLCPEIDELCQKEFKDLCILSYPELVQNG